MNAKIGLSHTVGILKHSHVVIVAADKYKAELR